MRHARRSSSWIQVLLVLALAGSARAQTEAVGWGANSDGQCNIPVLPAGVSFVRVTAGQFHSVGLRSDGFIRAWGDNSYGQCNIPILIPGATVLDLSSGGGWHTLFLMSDGSVRAFGSNLIGECNVPALPAGVSYVEISANSGVSLARRSDGAVIEWGDNSYAQDQVPALPPGLSFVEIAAGITHAIARLSDGSVIGWGDDTSGQCVAPSLPPGVTFVEISAGYEFSVGRCSDGSVVAWGKNNFGQCNVTPPPAGLQYTQISAGNYHTAAVRSDGVAVVWGGLYPPTVQNYPVLPPGWSYVEVSAGYEFSLAIRSAGDCNHNGLADVFDIQSGASSDCDGNQTPDECDLAAGGSAVDCDGNALLDSCEIAANPGLDLDQDGTLDRCQDAGSPYCFGDGTGGACPCDPGQIGSPGHGCANSTGEGAILSATGSISVTGDSLQLHITNMPNPSSVLFFQGTLQQSGGLGSFNGDGLICANGAGGGLIRLGSHGGQPGSSSFGAGIPGDPLISVRGAISALGGTRYYQAWYRDNAAFCTSAAYNFSNGLTIVWAP